MASRNRKGRDGAARDGAAGSARRPHGASRPRRSGTAARGRPRPPASPDDLDRIAADVVACELCPRLRTYCRRIAESKRRAYRDWTYWGRPVPGFGDPRARVLIVGLAPAAHGANRTGRMFTGDSSGDWLYRALHAAGFAALPTSVAHDDGQKLQDVFISAAARCAPPDNKPLPVELARCAPYLDRELGVLEEIRIVVALGQIAFRTALGLLDRSGYEIPRPRPAFGHNARTTLESTNAGRPPLVLLASYHPSRQNTQTGKLTRPMFDGVFAALRDLLDRSGRRASG
jgi:uracil-DNA glycosylase family 4